MQLLKNKGKKERKELSIEEIINLLLISIVTIMPFIVTSEISPRYVIGKVYYMYIVSTILIVLLIKKKKNELGIEGKIVITFIATIGVTILFSDFKGIALLGNPTRREGFFTFLMYIVMFIAALNWININNKVRNIVVSIPSIMAIYSIFQFYSFDPVYKMIISDGPNIASAGFIGNRNFFGTYIIIFLILNFSAFIFKGEKIYLINSTIQFSALVCTLTRSVWLSFGVVSLIGIVFIYKDKLMIKRAWISFIIFTSIFVVINISSKGNILGRVDSMVKDSVNITEDSGSGRIEIWYNTVKLILRNPIIGEGPDTLHKALEKYYPEEFQEYIEKNNKYIDKAHNEYLEYWASCGIFTLATYLILLITIGLNLFKRLERDKYKILLLTFIAYTVQAFFNISVPMVAPIWWIFLGYCVKCYREDDKKENEETIIVVDKEEALI